MHVFYSYKIENELIILDGDEFNHCKNVLRLKSGDNIQITDGKGNLFTCIIDSMSKTAFLCSIKTSEINTKKHSYYLHLAIAPTKNIDRTEWFVEKAIEIGVDEITFLQCEHSERKNINMDRMNKIAVSAMKQSQKTHLPILNDLTKYSAAITTISNQKYDKSFIAHLEESDRKELRNELDKQKKNLKYVLLIGPEGDFSTSEISLATKNNFQSVSLGESRLRTETAGIVGCSTFNIISS